MTSSSNVMAVSIVDKNNEQILFWNKLPSLESDYNFQMMFFCSLDAVEEKRKSQISMNSFDMYLGHLISVDDYQVLGYYSNTHTKILLICKESPLSEGNFKDLIISIHSLYVNARLNPFQSTSTNNLMGNITDKISNLVAKYTIKQV